MASPLESVTEAREGSEGLGVIAWGKIEVLIQTQWPWLSGGWRDRPWIMQQGGLLNTYCYLSKTTYPLQEQGEKIASWDFGLRDGLSDERSYSAAISGGSS